MKRKKILLFTGVSASVLLASSLLVACVAPAAGPGESETASSLPQSESVSVSSSTPASSRSTNQSQSANSRDSSSSNTMTESSHSQPPVSPSRPASSDTMQNPEAPVSAPSQQEPAAPPPPSTPQAPTPEPPPPAPSVNVQNCLDAAATWAGQRNMTVNGNLYIGGAGHENPIDTTGKTDAQVTEHLLHQLGLIHGQLAAMPEFDPAATYPCYKFEVVGNLIYVLYG